MKITREFSRGERVAAKVSGLGGTVQAVTDENLLIHFDRPADLTLWTRKIDVQ